MCTAWVPLTFDSWCHNQYGGTQYAIVNSLIVTDGSMFYTFDLSSFTTYCFKITRLCMRGSEGKCYPFHKWIKGLSYVRHINQWRKKLGSRLNFRTNMKRIRLAADRSIPGLPKLHMVKNLSLSIYQTYWQMEPLCATWSRRFWIYRFRPVWKRIFASSGCK